MTIINVQLSIQETKNLLAYIEELEQCAGIGGSYPVIYTTIKSRLQEAQNNEANLRVCQCGSGEPWTTCNGYEWSNQYCG